MIGNPFINDFERLTCLILAGGRGSRMNGEDKGLMDWHGRPLIQHLLDHIGCLFSNIVISANRHNDIYQNYGYPVIADEFGGYAGPLAGIHAALTVIKTPYLFVTPCDSPYMETNVAGRLYGQLQNSKAELAVADVDGRIEPLVMVLRTELKHSLDDYLRSDRHRASGWVLRQNHIKVPTNDLKKCFININTIDEKQKYAAVGR